MSTNTVKNPECSGTVSQFKTGEHFCLKWNNHQENLTGIMTKLLDEQKFVDVSLVCEMKTFKAHQTVLSASSPYFEQVLEENSHPHPIVILRDVKDAEMSALLQYMYRGEVNVRDHDLPAFLQIARALQVRGLSENVLKEEVSKKETSQCQQPRIFSESPQNLEAPSKRKRVSTSDSQINQGRRSTDSQQSSPMALVCKSKLTQEPNLHQQQQQQKQKPPSNLSTFSYSDILDEQLVDRPTTPRTPAIKRESDCVSAKFDSSEPYHVNHPVHMQPPANEPSADTVADLDLSICRKSLTPSATQVAYTSNTLPVKSDYSKSWHVKHAFEKIEGFGYKCKICGQIKQHRRNHYLKHFPEHHECHLCGRTYTRKDNLSSHLKRDHMQRVRNGGYRRRRARPSVNVVTAAEKPDVAPNFNRLFTHDVYSHMKFTMETALPDVSLRPLPPQMESLDLVTRPSPTTNLLPPSPCAPVYDTLPYFYNYLSQLNAGKGLPITHRH